MSTNLEITNVSSLFARVQALEKEIKSLKGGIEAEKQEDMASIICFSGEWDKLFAALTIASGSLAMGMEVHLFFTFWGINALRCAARKNGQNKSFPQSVLAQILPCGLGKARLSHLNFFGLGKFMMKKVMKKTGVDDIDILFSEIRELGAHFHLCNTTAELFGLQCSELTDIEKMDQCGVATFLSFALKSKTVLFI